MRKQSCLPARELERGQGCSFIDLKRFTLSLLVAAVAAGLAALPAAAKEGVKATLATTIPLDAEPGTQLRVAWTLTYAEGDVRGQPFGANGVFVRLLSTSVGRAETGFAPTGTHARGEYAATVVVPRDGVGDVEIGLRGWSDGPSGTRQSDLLFPITNDPMPGPARVTSPPSGGSERSSRSTDWIIGIGLASLLTICGLGLVVVRHKPASHA